jgi:cell division transport system ATP-binding protein
MDYDYCVQVENLSVEHNKNIVLQDVSFCLEKGDFTYLIGQTGSGKSSLMRVLYADLAIKTGLCKVCGFDLLHIKNREIPFLRRKIGIIFQDFQLLWDRTCAENLKFVLEATGWKNAKQIKQRIDQVLEQTQLSDKQKIMPHRLSGGEQQRLAIARALLNEPMLILADEPTGNLDPDTSAGIMDLLYGLAKTGKTVLMATHNYELMQKYPGTKILRSDKQTIQIA